MYKKKSTKLAIRRDTVKALVPELSDVGGGWGTSITIRTTTTVTTVLPSRQSCDPVTCIA